MQHKRFKTYMVEGKKREEKESRKYGYESKSTSFLSFLRLGTVMYRDTWTKLNSSKGPKKEKNFQEHYTFTEH